MTRVICYVKGNYENATTIVRKSLQFFYIRSVNNPVPASCQDSAAVAGDEAASMCRAPARFILLQAVVQFKCIDIAHLRC